MQSGRGLESHFDVQIDNNKLSNSLKSYRLRFRPPEAGWVGERGFSPALRRSPPEAGGFSRGRVEASGAKARLFFDQNVGLKAHSPTRNMNNADEAAPLQNRMSTEPTYLIN